MLYLYEHSFEGLLSAFAEALAANATTDEFATEADPQLSLFADVFRVSPDRGRAEALLARVRTRISHAAAERLTHLWLSEVPGLEAATLEYLRLGFEHGAAVDQYYTHPAVRATERVCRQVRGEIHRLHGLLRFRQLTDGSFAAPMAPDHNVILPVAWHFRQRLGGERWVIHDTRRRLGAFYDGRELELLEIAGTADAAAGLPAPSPAADPACYSAEERRFQALWREFFQAIALPGRRNPEQQRRCMPRRYWRYLVEEPAST